MGARGALHSCAIAALTARVGADGYLSKLITIIVPSTPGGGPDIWARILAEKLQTRFGHPVIVEDRPGAPISRAASMALARTLFPELPC